MREQGRAVGRFLFVMRRPVRAGHSGQRKKAMFRYEDFLGDDGVAARPFHPRRVPRVLDDEIRNGEETERLAGLLAGFVEQGHPEESPTGVQTAARIRPLPDALPKMEASGPMPSIREAELLSVATQAVEPQPFASSRETSTIVRMSVSRPPKRRGTVILSRPADRIATRFFFCNAAVRLGPCGVLFKHWLQKTGALDQGAAERCSGEMGDSGCIGVFNGVFNCVHL